MVDDISSVIDQQNLIDELYGNDDGTFGRDDVQSLVLENADLNGDGFLNDAELNELANLLNIDRTELDMILFQGESAHDIEVEQATDLLFDYYSTDEVAVASAM